MSKLIENVRDYWDSHLNCTQFLGDDKLPVGSDEFYKALEESMDRYSYKRLLFQDLVKSSAGSNLLEVGCGLGLELAQLGQIGFDVTGIDLSPRAAELAGTYLKRKGIKGETVVQNAEHMDFTDGTFDVVYSSGVLQHTPNIEKAILEIWRVLKPGEGY